ncbi:hypothetical protein BYT27DRAFT_7309999 [Phlegmacium glaucopus]|nr:hypothetical protein BYT27DRAFT_7309999 [Phlegmacium glaucopus]
MKLWSKWNVYRTIARSKSAGFVTLRRKKIALEAQKKEAEDYLRLKNDHTKALSRQHQRSLWQSLEREAKLSAQIEQLKQDLAEETDKNKDDVKHLALLRQHYEEREKTYVEVQTAAALAVEDLTANERQEIGLQERRKHTDGKAKKVKKLLKDDGAARKTALVAIENSHAKLKREKKKHDEYEVSLDEEEKVLESIQNSLKDKTQVFHDQIHAKQKELQPWTAQINTKQVEIDVATSERDALAKKAQTFQAVSKAAAETLKALQEVRNFQWTRWIFYVLFKGVKNRSAQA